MRDPVRVEGVLKRIGQAWSLCPDLRLGQLLKNAVRHSTTKGVLGQVDLFYVEDEDLVLMVEKHVEDSECFEPGGRKYRPGGRKK